MSGLIRAGARRISFVLAALLSAVAVAPLLAYAHAASRAPLTVVPTRALAASVPAHAYMLGGITSQGAPVVAAVWPRAKSVEVRVALSMNCTSGDQFVILARSYPRPVNGRGIVAGFNLVLPPDASSGFLGGSDVFGGHMDAARSRLTAHWRLRVQLKYSDGSTDTCDSGLVRFTAGS